MPTRNNVKTTICINGNEYVSVDEMPAEVRQTYEQATAMANLASIMASKAANSKSTVGSNVVIDRDESPKSEEIPTGTRPPKKCRFCNEEIEETKAVCPWCGRAQVEVQEQPAIWQKSKPAWIKLLEPLDLEQYVLELFTSMGYEALLTKHSGDHGVDVALRTKDGFYEIVQCKQWYDKLVGEPSLRDFYGALHSENAKRGYFVAPHGFTRQARCWVIGKPIVLADADWLADNFISPKVAREQRVTAFPVLGKRV